MYVGEQNSIYKKVLVEIGIPPLPNYFKNIKNVLISE